MPKKSKAHAQHAHEHNHGNGKISHWFWIRSIFIGLLFIYFIIINIIEPEGLIKYTWHYGIWIPITTYIVLWEGRQYLKIYKRIYKLTFDMDTLIGLAAHTLYVFSIAMAIINYDSPMFSYEQMWEGTAVLIVITNIGHALEDKVRHSSLKAYEKLDAMRNAQAIVLRNNQQVKMQASQLKIGDIIIVPRGQLVPLDGTVMSDASFDYSNITGESKTIHLTQGQFVVSGSYNASEAVKIKITKKYEDSTINSIVESIENVSMARPKMQKLADKILVYFVPSVLMIAFLTFLIWLIIGYTSGYHVSWIDNDEATYLTAIKAGVTVMAIACPCALGIATPLIYTVSSLLSNENGILINDPKALEEMAKIKIVAFDKTGTITSENFEVEAIEGDQSFLPVISSLEQNIQHPIAQTLVKLSTIQAQVSNIKHIDNHGVSGIWAGKKVEMKKYESKSQTTDVALYVDNDPKVIIRLINNIKEHVKETIADLHKKGIKTVMITGDNQGVANYIAQKINIDQVYAEVKPNDKAKIIKQLQQKGKVAFVGDGFNDSIAMKQANVSIAFASGSDITNSLSDISITKNTFESIEKVLLLSRMNNNGVKVALSYAFSFNVITIPVAFLLLVQPWVGASIMALSDFLVAMHAFIYRLRGTRKLKDI